jgi:hypothetical protein
MLAVVPVLADAVAELAYTVGTTGADGLGDRLERALDEDVKLLALTVDERAIILAALEDTPEGLAELRPCSSTRRVAAAGIELECLLASLTVLLDDGKTLDLLHDPFELGVHMAPLDDEVRREATERFVLVDRDGDSLHAVVIRALAHEVGTVTERHMELLIARLNLLVHRAEQRLITRNAQRCGLRVF